MSQPIRMCIACRERALQSDLQRVQIIDGKLVEFTKAGRSFYVCETCITCNAKKLLKIVNHRCKTHHQTLSECGKIFKEIGTDG